MFTRKHECGATIDLDHIRQHIVCVWEVARPIGKVRFILYYCRCGSSVSILYDEVPEEIRLQAGLVEERRRNIWPTMKAQ